MGLFELGLLLHKTLVALPWDGFAVASQALEQGCIFRLQFFQLLCTDGTDLGRRVRAQLETSFPGGVVLA